MLHPYALDIGEWDPSRKIIAEVTGETMNGVPHGLCKVKFIYNGELHKEG